MANIFRTASIWLKVAIISLTIGLIIFVIGFATTSWIVHPQARNSFSFGLWQLYSCSPQCAAYTYDIINDYHRAIQAMECIGLIGYSIAIITLLLYMCSDSFRRRDLLQIATAVTFAGILFACIGFALFGSRSNTENRFGLYGEIGWSMGIAIAGTVLNGIGGIMLIMQLVR